MSCSSLPSPTRGFSPSLNQIPSKENADTYYSMSYRIKQREKKTLLTHSFANSDNTTASSPPQTDPLQKAMTAFAAALDVPLSKLRFTFDGDLVDPNQTAQDLDMENDDVIDAAAI